MENAMGQVPDPPRRRWCQRPLSPSLSLPLLTAGKVPDAPSRLTSRGRRGGARLSHGRRGSTRSLQRIVRAMHAVRAMRAMRAVRTMRAGVCGACNACGWVRVRQARRWVVWR